MKVYTKTVADCTQCPFFEEDNHYDNNGNLIQIKFLCEAEMRVVGYSQKNKDGVFENSYCKIPDWCPLDDEEL